MLNASRSQPECGDVGVDEHSDAGEDDPKGSEEVEGAAHVAAEIHYREQVQESLKQPAPATPGRRQLVPALVACLPFLRPFFLPLPPPSSPSTAAASGPPSPSADSRARMRKSSYGLTYEAPYNPLHNKRVLDAEEERNPLRSPWYRQHHAHPAF